MKFKVVDKILEEDLTQLNESPEIIFLRALKNIPVVDALPSDWDDPEDSFYDLEAN